MTCPRCGATAGLMAERYQGLVIERWRCAAGHSGTVAVYGQAVVARPPDGRETKPGRKPFTQSVSRTA